MWSSKLFFFIRKRLVVAQSANISIFLLLLGQIDDGDLEIESGFSDQFLMMLTRKSYSVFVSI